MELQKALVERVRKSLENNRIHTVPGTSVNFMIQKDYTYHPAEQIKVIEKTIEEIDTE